MIEKLISGGQSGADRAGLDVAKALGIPTGGMAPKGWRISLPNGIGSDPSLAEFGLIESDSYEYPPRTKWNVTNSDGTVWFGFLDSPGAKLTLSTAKEAGKPTIINPTAQGLHEWLKANQIKVLNVAGNRLSSFNPDIYEQTYNVLILALNEAELLKTSMSLFEEQLNKSLAELPNILARVLYSDFDRKFAIKFIVADPTPINKLPNPEDRIEEYLTDWFLVRKGPDSIKAAIAQLELIAASVRNPVDCSEVKTPVDMQRINNLAGYFLTPLELYGWVVYFGVSEQFFMIRGLFDESNEFETCAYSSVGTDDEIRCRFDLAVKEITDLKKALVG